MSDNRLRLIEYLEAMMAEPFIWGKTDCMSFANAAVKAQRGHGFVDDILERRYSTEFGAMLLWRRAQAMTGCRDVVTLLDSRLTRSASRYPVMGSVVARPLADAVVFSHRIGIMGGRAVPLYMTADGFAQIDLSDGDLAWEI